MERQELQNRRAVNQIWNGAGRYDVQPEQAAFDEGGDPELYLNTVMGLARRDYDFARFQPMLHTFQQQPQGGLYSDIFWLGLEHAVYEKESPRRPALEALRRQHARRLLAESGEGGDPRQIPALRRIWAARVLGQSHTEDDWQTALLDELAFAPELDEQQLIHRTEELLYRYFRRARRSVTDRQWAAWAGRSLTKGGGVRFIKPNALRALSHTDSGGGAGQSPKLLSFLQGRTPEPILRRYVEDCFGVSMLTPSELAEAERLLCTGVHKNCRLHFTKGAPPDGPRSEESHRWTQKNLGKAGDEAVQEYYNGVHTLSGDDFATAIYSVVSVLMGQRELRTQNVKEFLPFMFQPDTRYFTEPSFERDIPVAMIEQRYQVENEMLEAVTRGDENAAILSIHQFGRFSLGDRFIGTLYREKSQFIIMNTLLLKAIIF